jgi:hypothetical protein
MADGTLLLPTGRDGDVRKLSGSAVNCYIHRKSRSTGKPSGAVVAAIRQLDWMCGLGINSQRGYSGYRRPPECLHFHNAMFAVSPDCSTGEIRSGG